MPRRAVVALTDQRWFTFLRSRTLDETIDEVNFWRPKAQTSFRSVDTGEPFFFRLKSPTNAIVGYGFFAVATRVPIRLAWDTFGERNGDPNFDGFLGRIAEYRGRAKADLLRENEELLCLVLRGVRFLPEADWLSWGSEHEWGRSIVALKTYDLDTGPGVTLHRVLLQSPRPPDLEPAYIPPLDDSRTYDERVVAVREGQGAFRLRVLDAYDRRCSVTGERSLPVLDAAHIQPYNGPASNHVQNGLSLRADIHRLYDAGYVTVTPDHHFLVSERLQQDYENGRVYYGFQGHRVRVLPTDARKRPSPQALEWHASNVFR